jgi:hypothetical protein
MHLPIMTWLTHIHGHHCVAENDVSVIMDTEELIGEVTEMQWTAM